MGWDQPLSILISSQISARPLGTLKRAALTLMNWPLICHMLLVLSKRKLRTGAAAISAAVSGGSGRRLAGTRLRSWAVGQRSTTIFSTRTPGSLMSLGPRVSSWRMRLTR
ncbi:hypothetical protein D3C78_977660 [compost metagenome]